MYTLDHADEARLNVLFLHAAINESSEYSVHRLLAQHVDPAEVSTYFVYQSPAINRYPAGRALCRDFGRDMSIRPKPSKLHRALLTMKCLPGALLSLNRVITDIRPSVVYTTQRDYDLILGAYCSRVFRIPHYVHLHYVMGPWLGRLALRQIRHADLVISVSEYVRGTAIGCGVPGAAVKTLHNGIDAGPQPSTAHRDSLRQKFGFAPTTPVLTAVARIDYGKGHPMLLDAFATVCDRRPDARLLLCGAPTVSAYYSQIEGQVRKLRLEGQVIFAGFRRDVPEILAGSDIFCLPTTNDPFPLVFLEAMATGLPVVACRSGGVPELVTHAETGLLCEPNDVESLAEYLLTLVENRELRERLGAAGRTRVVEDFSGEKIAAKWCQLLCESGAA